MPPLADTIADSRRLQAGAIEVASIQDGIAVIDKGLSAGQRVVVDGQYKLKPGARIAEAPRGPAKLADAGAHAVARLLATYFSVGEDDGQARIGLDNVARTVAASLKLENVAAAKD